MITEAAEPIAQFWPMKNFVHHNPIHGLEHLPFEKAVREAKHLLGGNGYLPNREYRRLYRDGRITAEGVVRALQRVAPRPTGHIAIQPGSRRIEASDVKRVHLLYGLEPPRTAHGTSGPDGTIRDFPDDLPFESRQRILESWKRDGELARDTNEGYFRDLWQSATQSAYSASVCAPAVPFEIALPAHRTVGDWIDLLIGSSIVEAINNEMTKWVPAFVDEGMAGWEMPSRHEGLYKAWRELSPKDLSSRFLGIKEFSRKVSALPDSPEHAITLLLERLGVPQDRWTGYLSRHLAQLPGWAGFIRWLGENPTYPGQKGHPTDPVQYLAVRLFYEVELADVVCSREWGISGTVPALVSYWQDHAEEYQHLIAPDVGADDSQESSEASRLFRVAQFIELMPAEVGALSSEDVRTLLGWLDSFPESEHGPVWLEAYEDKYREDLLNTLAGHGGEPAESPARPRAQIVFCIDVRSESFRRHVEAQGPYETLGFAGFFGVAMNHQAFDSEERFPLCPVLLKPSHAVDEVVRPAQDKALQSYASGTRWRRLTDHLFHDVKQNPVASFMLVDVTGLFFSLGLTGKTLFPKFHEFVKGGIRGWFCSSGATRIQVARATASENGAAARGFTSEEQANMVEGGLRATGLTNNFGRFVVLCGHGSISDNNPYFGALHCGACGGKHGDPNARAFAAMGNNPEVRLLLKDRGLDIPDDTRFLPAKHITTSDRIVLYDLEDLPVSHREDLRLMMSDLEKAGASQALERCGRMPRAPKMREPERAYRHVATRTADWANVRPEWGLSGNAAFLIGRRSLTKGVDLQGRVFLHSYDPEQDAEGKILEKIMTAPLIVGEWINMEHYFSAVDPWFWGSGSKVIHNVVSGVGVMLGSQGDLQTGLPLQTVNDGAAHYHEPMRLLTVIEAPCARISHVIQKHPLLQHLFHNRWVNLAALDPATSEFHRYNADGTWEATHVMGAARFAGSATI